MIKITHIAAIGLDKFEVLCLFVCLFVRLLDFFGISHNDVILKSACVGPHCLLKAGGDANTIQTNSAWVGKCSWTRLRSTAHPSISRFEFLCILLYSLLMNGIILLMNGIRQPTKLIN